MRESDAEGQIYTFYSYKGGVGRSMALANVAALLARWGKRVLIIDWDLEAPGLEQYFSEMVDPAAVRARPGVVDLLQAIDGAKQANADFRRVVAPLDWRGCLTSIDMGSGASLDLLGAGRRDEGYFERLLSLNLDEAAQRDCIGCALNALREDWARAYDFVLVDSRTGINEIGGMCTVVLPDVLVLLFTANQQGIDGVIDVMRRARAAQDNLPDGRGRLIALPVLSRDESRTEYELAMQWRARIAAAMHEFYRDWLVRGVEPEEVLRRLHIPYWPFWSFGEQLPVVKAASEISDPTSIVAAYARLATLIKNRLDWRSLDQESTNAELDETRRRSERAERELSHRRELVQTYLSLVMSGIAALLFACSVLGVYGMATIWLPDLGQAFFARHCAGGWPGPGAGWACWYAVFMGVALTLVPIMGFVGAYGSWQGWPHKLWARRNGLHAEIARLEAERGRGGTA